ncbi:anthranilate synthase family protein [Parafrankia sp. BMG5.11]|uniref:anthranilate synthase family protein n=1 Tax=Parafrankia sp. BMG5.11 TaxID=222540 RepID=UPI00103BE879|nr:anthranilate synthase family protein [Parafrankia sp. BMG5.11]TCJ31485.1 phenazine-specific anthranilate synthase component I [Parafrankia sp. BMG5.11]
MTNSTEGTHTEAGTAKELLGRVLANEQRAFALLYRPDASGHDGIDLLVGEVSTHATLAELPLPITPSAPGTATADLFVLIPYRQIAERGFECVDDGSPLVAMNVTGQAVLPVATFLDHVADMPIQVTGGGFDTDDDAYAEIVRRIITTEIGEGEGANFVIRRSFVADITDFEPRTALVLFRRLLQRESGTYWTFVVHTGERTFVGVTPERHITLDDGVAVMNPISGTYRYPPAGPTLDGIKRFIVDRKETDELHMVLDEELKMMARVCDTGGRVSGPHLREMARLAHTEYFIEGRSSRDAREILRETMFAPTVTGSPLESACRVIRRHEPEGRGYYSGVAALLGHDHRGKPSLDSAILIRTADIDPAGRLSIGAGATLVRHSDPAAEVAETWAKASGLLSALMTDTSRRFADHPEVSGALADRSGTIAAFWQADNRDYDRPDPELGGRRVLVIDAEDAFTEMIKQQLRSIGLSVTVRRFDEPYGFDGFDLVIMGPGPGDPRDDENPKISRLRSVVRTLLAEQRPFLAVCLSHQVLSRELGLSLAPCAVLNQGIQKEIDLFGRTERVGFYNSFTALSREDKADCPGVGIVEIGRDAYTGEVHALRGPRFGSIQFHAESVLTQDGVRILGTLAKRVLAV